MIQIGSITFDVKRLFKVPYVMFEAEINYLKI